MTNSNTSEGLQAPSVATPRPWHVELIKGSYQRPALVVGNGKTVAQCIGNQLEPDETSIGEAKANAHLIVSAVDAHDALVAALRKIIGQAGIPDPLDACRAIIATAEAALATADPSVPSEEPR